MKSYLVFLTIVSSLLISGCSLHTQNSASNSKSVVQNSIRKTNQWYSSVLKSNVSDGVFFSYPLAFKIDKDKVSVSYPQLNSVPKTVFASFVPQVNFKFPKEIKQLSVHRIGDFSLSLEIRVGEETYYIQSVRGLPSLVITPANQIVVEGIGTEIIESSESSYLLNNKDFNFVINKDNNSLRLHLSNNNFDKSKVELIDKSTIESTDVSWKENEKSVDITLNVKNNRDGLIGLLPVHYLNSDNTNLYDGFKTLRGDIKYSLSNSFTFRLPRYDILRSKRIKDSRLLKKIKSTISQEAIKQKSIRTESKNYFLGVELGRIARLLELSIKYEVSDATSLLTNELLTRLEEGLTHYKYDDTKKSLISTKPEFGNENNNDHHFHYGYFINAASVLLENKVTLSDTSKNVITDMISDIANPHKDERFPILRHFDLFEGHSWADGYGSSPDGNNQESTSEAIQAWYSLIRWGKVTNDKAVQSLGVMLFNYEIASTKCYWFNECGVYTQPYAHEIASIVWGGKADFATWFSGEANMIYGIQLLPISDWSFYLGSLNNAQRYFRDITTSGGNSSKEWGDLIDMWKSMYLKTEIQNKSLPTKVQDGNSLSNYLDFVYSE